MSDRSGDGVSRRQIGALALACSTAGCLGFEVNEAEKPTATLETEGQYIADVELDVDEQLIGSPDLELGVELKLPEEGPQITAVVLISPEGEQINAERVLTGETSAKFTRSIHEGEYELVALSGGELECAIAYCSHSGGDILERRKVVIGLAD